MTARARPQPTSCARRRESPSTRRPSSQLGSSSVTFETSRWRTRSGSIPSSTRTRRIGVPAAQAWGRAAVGYAIGNGVSSRAYPAKTSGSDQSKWAAASISARATRRAASGYPSRARPHGERRVVRPDGAVVVRDRVVGGLVARHRADPPPRPERLRQKLVHHRRDSLGQEDPAPEQVAHVRAPGVDVPLLAVQRECEEPARSSTQKALSNATRSLSASSSSRSASRLAPDVPRDLGQPALRGVHPCTSTGATGASAKRPSWKRCESPSPSRTDSRGRRPHAARTRRSRHRRRRRSGRSTRAPAWPAHGGAAREPRRRSSATSRRGARGIAGSSRSSRSSAETRTRPRGRDGPRARSSRARRRSPDPRTWPAAPRGASRAPIAGSGPRSSDCSEVIAVSRPKTVMNHGMPAAKSGRRNSPVRIRRAARSAIDRSNARRRLSQPPRTRGTRSVHAATTSPSVSRSSLRCSTGGSGSASASSDGTTSTVRSALVGIE